jgi:hypothetical protein
MERRKVTVRLTTLEDEGRDEDVAALTPSQRLGMMRDLSENPWVPDERTKAEARVSRRVVRIYQR